MNTKKLTNLQKRQRLKRSRHDERVKKLSKYQALCIYQGFFEYALKQSWDDEMVDAAALIMHRYFIRRRKSNNAGWVHMPYQLFREMYGTKYKEIRDRLIESGFLERDNERGYKIGKHCTYYRLCGELRDNWVSASYRLKTEEMQIRYIENKKRWIRMSAAKRREYVTKIIEEAFSKEQSALAADFDRRDRNSYYSLVEEGDLTEEQFETIKRLAENTLLLQLNISPSEIEDIAKKRYQKKAQKFKCDFKAYEQKFQEMAERTFEPRIRVKANGRFFSPYSSIPREMWEHVHYKGKPLAGVDIKTSHVICLLAFIKDIDIYYINGEGTHDERLARCQFEKQITIVRGLIEHLRRNCLLLQAHQYFKFNPHKLFDRTQCRKLAYSTFQKFTKSYIKFIQLENCRTTGTIPNQPVNSHEFLQYIQALLDIQHSTRFSYNKFNNLHLPSSPPPISANRPVGFSLQPAFYQGVIEKIHACRFSLKFLFESEDDDFGNKDTFPFRNLVFPCRDEIDEFEKLLDGDIYTSLMNAIGISGVMKRNEFKKCFFHFLYRPAFRRFESRYRRENVFELSREKEEEPVRKAFESLLPSITFFLDLCKCRPGTLDGKGSYYKWISRAMLSVESQIMLECCANLWKKYPKMFLVTLHDCIKCLPKDIKKVQAELTRTWKKYHVSPKFETKIHGSRKIIDSREPNQQEQQS